MKNLYKKTLIIIFIMIITLILQSCTNVKDTYMKHFHSEEWYREKYISSMVKCINTKNTNAFKKKLSKTIRNNNNIDEKINKIFYFIKEPILSYKFKDGGADQLLENGKTHNVSSTYYLYTKNYIYAYSFKICIEDNNNSDRMGCYIIQIDLKSELEKNVQNDDYFMYNTPKEGIFYPGWENEAD